MIEIIDNECTCLDKNKCRKRAIKTFDPNMNKQVKIIFCNDLLRCMQSVNDSFMDSVELIIRKHIKFPIKSSKCNKKWNVILNYQICKSPYIIIGFSLFDLIKFTSESFYNHYEFMYYILDSNFNCNFSSNIFRKELRKLLKVESMEEKEFLINNILIDMLKRK